MLPLLRSIPKRVLGLSSEFRRWSGSIAMPETNLDPIQKALLEERCILVDSNDRIIGQESKRTCHTWIDNQCPLHRAFSVFLFDKKGRLVLQKRSAAKITFPLYITNTCCSHPLYVDDELEEQDAVGVKRAALRRLNFELGIQLDMEDLTYLTRVHYQAPSDSGWGEHEIDYILIAQKNVEMQPNSNEVESVHFVERNDLKNYLSQLKSEGVPVTPWFDLVTRHFLPLWWDNLGKLNQFQDHDRIHKF